jgi:hypothetical protein
MEPKTSSGSVKELVEKLEEEKLDYWNRTLVVESCCNGGLAESIAEAIRVWSGQDIVNVEGITLNHNSDFRFDHTIPIHALSSHARDTERWAWIISNHRMLGSGQSVFQPSDVIGTGPHLALPNYKSTVLGLYDGLSDCAEPLTSSEIAAPGKRPTTQRKND